ncbi:terminase small subunit [Burkholderia sp. Bp9031]|uniref:terminase small subunit n=1 Tax=Burkholderia sp. Bp9031 TaxID=2184566 RepID=UPI000F5FE7A9|nr:terminase small subunit [Burkholderia sp. Bp9031]RQZ14045.1 terminase small subunit [Burkholderia sp. Bp9031]
MSESQTPPKNEAKAARYPTELWKTIRELWEGDATMSFAQAAKLSSERHGTDAPTKGACAAYAKRNGWAKRAAAVDAHRVIEPDQGRATCEAPSSGSSRAVDQPAEFPSDRLLKALTDRQRLFALEYMVDLNATAAYMRAFAAEKRTTASTEGSRLLGNPCVKAFFAAKIKERAERCETDADMVLLAWRDIATADPNDICEYRRECCRHCYGLNFRYHYTPAEMDDARKKHDEERLTTLAATESKVDIGEFDEQGGVGFNGTLDPNPDCPECFGEGIGRAHFKDTRKLSPASRALYGGVKIGRDGIELKIHSKDGALDAIARHNQMFIEKVEVSGSAFDPIELEKRFGAAMASARARTAAVMQERDKLGDE